jgi:hypothetical protein
MEKIEMTDETPKEKPRCVFVGCIAPAAPSDEWPHTASLDGYQSIPTRTHHPLTLTPKRRPAERKRREAREWWMHTYNGSRAKEPCCEMAIRVREVPSPRRKKKGK